MSNPLGWSPDQLWGNQERLLGGKTKLKLERWKGINIGGSELHPYSPTHPKTPPPSSHDVQGTSRGGQRRFTFVRIKKNAGCDCYSSFINSQECHNATVNLCLPTPVYITLFFLKGKQLNIRF